MRDCEFGRKIADKVKAERIMKEIVKEIYEHCDEYLRFVTEIGNECAYTDRIVEKIIEKARKLKERYDEEV